MDPDPNVLETSAVPPELAGPSPRKTRLTGNGIGMLILAAVLFLFAGYSGLKVHTQVAQQKQQEAVLLHSGSETTGRIKRVWVPDEMTVHWVSYAFAVNGASFKGEARVPNQLLHNVESSNTLRIRYLPGNPALNHPAAWNGSPRWNWEWIAIPITLAVVFGVWMLLQLWRQRQLVAQGTPAQAVVTKCSFARGSYGQGFNVKYEFRVGGGMVMEGAGWSGNQKDAGAKIWVLYLPENPQRNRPYPLQGVRGVLPSA